MASYTATVNGITLTSNIPVNISPSAGHYHYVLSLSMPAVLALALNGSSILETASQIEQQVAQRTGSPVKNTTLQISGNDMILDFDAGSPPVIIAIGVILGILALIVFAIVAINFIYSPAVQVGIGAIGIAIAAGVGFLFYSFVKNREFRQHAVSYAGSAAGRAGRAALETGGKIAGKTVEYGGKAAKYVVGKAGL